MMDDVKKKVMLDLFVSPMTLVPLALGATGVIAGWANDGPASLVFGSFCLLVIGVGVTITKMVFGINAATKRIYQQIQQKQDQEKEQQLDQLEDKLSYDGDDRTTQAMRNLRAIYKQFQKGVAEKRISAAAVSLISDNVNTLFQGCVSQLEHSYELHTEQRKLRSGIAKQALTAQRDKVVDEVLKSIDQLGKTVQQCWTNASDNNPNGLSQMRQELEENMEVARRTEQQMREISGKVYKESDFQ